MTKLLIAVMASAALARSQNPQGVPENAVTRVSEHVYAIVGFPNIAIVVGSRATLVVDTGMGPRNGAVIVREAQKLAKAPALYLTTTHFHPEHATGEQAFPPQTILIRPVAQQDEMDRRGAEYIQLFSSRSAQNKELLQNVKLRPPDLVFDREIKLDLGGVTARLFWLGAAHTKGDELIFVEEDSVLIPGDLVQNKLVPNMPNEDASAQGWLAILDQLETLHARLVVPDHGALGDGSLVAQERAFLADLQGRARALERQGVSADEAGRMLTTEFQSKYPDWTNLGPLANVVRRVYAESR
ncbi:MAG: MBL fold metallo-hydrolase [Acidobacteriia bacterium]|nr:MBL fold metallo-hydrolase [Terriglobia bacterium]